MVSVVPALSSTIFSSKSVASRQVEVEGGVWAKISTYIVKSILGFDSRTLLHQMLGLWKSYRRHKSAEAEISFEKNSKNIEVVIRCDIE